MDSLLDKLYAGELSPGYAQPSAKLAWLQAQSACNQEIEAYSSRLDAKERAVFEALWERAMELADMREAAAFRKGFRIGLRLTAEAFEEEDAGL